MSAFLVMTESDRSGITLDRVKDAIAEQGICYGLVPDEVIEEYIGQARTGSEDLKIAEGTRPIAGQNGMIKYYFNTDPLRIGTIKEGGTIDFRDRGRLPAVSKGTLLARRIPAVPGKPGRNVFGKELVPPKPKEARLRPGKGVERSEDGNEARAARDGSPMLSADGKIYVMSRMEVSGDVGLETGHVDFEGDVKIEGAIQDNFRVKGERISAGEIQRADVTASGDVVVTGGIIGGTVRTDGSLRARYVHEGRIRALGDVVVEKEVIDSDIITEGAFIIRDGKVFNSRISAKKGIYAHQIGSDKSKPCRLVVGIAEGAASRIDYLKANKQAKEKKQKKFQAAVEKLTEALSKLFKDLSELAYFSDRGRLELKSMQTKGESSAEKIQSLQRKIAESEMRSNILMEKQEKIEAKLEYLEQAIKRLESDKESIVQEIEDIYEWSLSTGSKAEIKVSGTVFAHTMVRGPHCSIEIKKNLTGLVLNEKQVEDAQTHSQEWNMVASSLKK